MYYYGDLATIACGAQLLQLVNTETPLPGHAWSLHQEQLAAQILMNSRIAAGKFRLFSIAVRFAAIAVAPIPLLLVVALIDAMFR
jgi:hypothetical protein